MASRACDWPTIRCCIDCLSERTARISSSACGRRECRSRPEPPGPPPGHRPPGRPAQLFFHLQGGSPCSAVSGQMAPSPRRQASPSAVSAVRTASRPRWRPASFPAPSAPPAQRGGSLRAARSAVNACVAFAVVGPRGGLRAPGSPSSVFGEGRCGGGGPRLAAAQENGEQSESEAGGSVDQADRLVRAIAGRRRR